MIPVLVFRFVAVDIISLCRERAMAQNHYETLGVARDASNEEIKAAFLKLSKTNHPDIAGVANTSRFQEISNAAGVLCDKAKRESYDLSLRGGTGPIYSPASVFGKNRPPPRGSGQNLSGFEETLQSALRPRHLLIGGIGMFILASVVNYLEGDKNNNSNNRMNQSQFLAPHRRQSNQLVQAWMNPQTGHWEQPAPWDPNYRRLRPKLELVSREKVKFRAR